MEQNFINKFPEYDFIEFGDDGKPHNMYRGIDVGFGRLYSFKPRYLHRCCIT